MEHLESRGYSGLTWGLYRLRRRIMEGFRDVCPIMENQMEKKMEHWMGTRVGVNPSPY